MPWLTGLNFFFDSVIAKIDCGNTEGVYFTCPRCVLTFRNTTDKRNLITVLWDVILFFYSKYPQFHLFVF